MTNSAKQYETNLAAGEYKWLQQYLSSMNVDDQFDVDLIYMIHNHQLLYFPIEWITGHLSQSGITLE